MYNYRTDLADERTDIFKKNNHIENNIIFVGFDF